MKYLPSSHCRLLMNPCIIKNELNPTIMSYCDNQKPLIHFLPVPPSTHQLPECIFPMSFESVSPKKKEGWGDHEKQVLVHPWASPGPDVLPCHQILHTLLRVSLHIPTITSQDGKWELQYHSHSSVRVSFCSYAYWHGSIHRTAFLQWYISAGGAGCTLVGRPRGLLLCIRVHSLLKTSRWAPPSRVGNTSPRN